jgi:hypothetical protein
MTSTESPKPKRLTSLLKTNPQVPMSLEERQAAGEADLKLFQHLAKSKDPEVASMARNVVRSLQAALQAGKMALDYQNDPKAQQENERTLGIYRLLRMPPPTLPGQTPSTSAKTET